MAQVRSAILCDFAQVRDGLLFISSGGITRIGASDPGAPVGFSLGGILEVLPVEDGPTHEIAVKVVSVESSEVRWQAQLSINTGESPEGLFPGESLHLPFAMPVGPFPATSFGPHDLKITVNDAETELLTFYVLHMVAN